MKKTLNIQGHLLDLSKPKVMGIVNMTPDSFHDKSRNLHNRKQREKTIYDMVAQGVDIIDIGGYSTRPGASEVSVEEEKKRVLPVIKWITRIYPNAKISIDTFRSEVARAAINEGAAVVNDISGGTLDVMMPQTVAELRVPYILMHTRGTPATMQSQAIYNDVILDVLTELQQRIALFEEKGVKDIVVDVGFGFAKTIEQNFELLHGLHNFEILQKPLLVGISRKSMVWKTLDISPAAALNGTTALHMLALSKGASFLRVHDVQEAIQVIRLFSKVNI